MNSTFANSDAGFINRLFTQLQAIFPAWRQAFGDEAAVAEAKRQWTLGMIEAGLTNGDAIKAGLSRARRSKNPFIPSVGMFIDWCHEAVRERSNFPTIDCVILQITRYSHNRKFPDPKFVPEIHPVSYWIYQHINTYALSHAEEKEARRMVGVVYTEASEKASQGFEFPKPPELIPEGVGKNAEMTSEQIAEAAAARAEIRKFIGRPA